MCTGIRFTGSNGNMYFGRNLDWSVSYGERVVVTPAGCMLPQAFGNPAYGKHCVMGMGIVAEGLPLYFDCANEAGLAVAGLNFPGYAQYEKAPVTGKDNVAAYEFPLWVARNFASVDEVEAALAGTAIVAKPVNDTYPVSMLHWLIGDASRSIVVECTAGGLQVFHDDVDVLTNQPGFAWHRENLRNYITLSSDMPAPATWDKAELAPFGAGAGARALPGDPYSTSRFVRAAFYNANYPAQTGEAANVSRLFHTLGGVAMIDGAARMADGSFEKTLYTSGYSAASKTYYLSTYDDPAIKTYRMADFDHASRELVEV